MRGDEVLGYAIRLPVLGRYLGQLMLVMAALALVPLACSLVFAEHHLADRYALVAGALAVAGYALSRLRRPDRVQHNEGMAIVALAFLLSPLAMSWPLSAPGLPWTDALFEAISGVTTTGLTTLADPAAMPRTFLFSRAWMQWYGGLGIMAFSLAVVQRAGPVVLGLSASEPAKDDLLGSTREHALRVIAVYGALTGVGLVVAWLLAGDFFQALLYTFAAVSTGGFAPQAGSLAGAASPWFPAWILVLCLFGAVPFAFYHGTRRYRFNLRQIASLLGFVLALTALLFGLFLFDGMGWVPALRHATATAMSAQSTAGFSTLDIAALDPAAKLALIPAMLIGGGVGSTAGGIKIVRVLILVHLVIVIVRHTRLAPHAYETFRIEERRYAAGEVNRALALLALFVAVVLLSWLPFVVLGHDPLDALFEVASATGTVGLSSGVTSPELHPLLKAVLCADMLLGRLEVIAWLVLLGPRTWIGRRMRS